jgi:hypothetical protein
MQQAHVSMQEERTRSMEEQQLAQKLADQLEAVHGPLLSGQALYRALGLSNSAAFRQARQRGHVNVALFTLPNRRGQFALSREVATWLAKMRFSATSIS